MYIAYINYTMYIYIYIECVQIFFYFFWRDARSPVVQLGNVCSVSRLRKGSL